jgi:nicotinate-nucleotide adenylyltransferase
VKALGSLGIFGGSFNPVHTGHVLLARHAREALKLDEVWLIPCACSADGKELASGVLRLRWLKAALRGEEGLRAGDIELKRGGISRTIDTLRALRASLGPAVTFTLLMGQDQASRFPRWKEAAAIPALARLAVFRRPGALPKPLRPLRIGKAADMALISAPLYEISSSDIRSRIRHKKSVALLVPPALVLDASLKKAFR